MSETAPDHYHPRWRDAHPSFASMGTLDMLSMLRPYSSWPTVYARNDDPSSLVTVEDMPVAENNDGLLTKLRFTTSVDDDGRPSGYVLADYRTGKQVSEMVGGQETDIPVSEVKVDMLIDTVMLDSTEISPPAATRPES